MCVNNLKGLRVVDRNVIGRETDECAILLVQGMHVLGPVALSGDPAEPDIGEPSKEGSWSVVPPNVMSVDKVWEDENDEKCC